MTTTQECRLTSRPEGWRHDGPTLDHSEEACFRWEILNERRASVGYVTNLRPTGFPPAWQNSIFRDDHSLEVYGEAEYATIEDAIAAMNQVLIDRENKRVPSILDFMVDDLHKIKVEAILRSYPEGITVDEIGDKFHFSTNFVRAVLHRLQEHGKISVDSAKRWTLSSPR